MIVTLARGRLHYAWVVVAATFATTLVVAGIRSMPGVLILPLEGEFGWNRATVSLALSINLLLYGLSGPFAAAIMEAVGIRRMMVGALLILALAVGLTTQMRAAWQLQLLWGLLAGMGAGAMSGWVAATVSNRWFVERRGLAVGLLGTANATGQLVFLPGLAWLVDLWGWRAAALGAAGAALAMIPLVLFFIRDHPHEVGLRPYGVGVEVGVVPPPQIATANPFAEAMRTLWQGLHDRDFLLLAGSFFVCGASANGLIGTHLIPASVEHGMSDVMAANFLALIGGFSVVGAISSGWLSDRFDNRRLLAWYYGLRGLSLLFLPYAFSAGIPSLAIFVVFYGLDWSATGPATTRLTADLFGKRHVGTIFAWLLVSHQVGAAAVSFAAGVLHTWLGDYHASFFISGALCMVAVGFVSSIRRPASRQQLIGRAEWPVLQPHP